MTKQYAEGRCPVLATTVPAYVSIKAHTLSVSLGHTRVYAFDGEGRLLYGFRHGRGYKRGLDDRVLLKHWQRHGGELEHVRRELATGERERFFAALARDLAHARTALVRGTAVLVGSTGAGLALGWVERCLAMDRTARAADAAKCQQVYRPVGILPPDQYQSVVLQLTEGCPHNRCTFCTFYRDRPFRVKPLAEFRVHVAAVRTFLGAGIEARHSVFLADANALSMPQRHLEAALELIRAELAGSGPYGVFSFMDVFTGRTKTETELRRLADLGVRRVYLGVETGCPDLLRFLNKPGDPARVTQLCAALQAAGIGIGAIVMAGAGGDRFQASHEHRTVELLAALTLGPQDIVYLSEFVQQPGSEYAASAHAGAVRALSRPAVQAQMQAFRDAARQGREPGCGPRVAPYDIREFLY